jgi:hypothetical protein
MAAPWHPEALGAMTPLPPCEDIAPRVSASAARGDWPEAPLHDQSPDDGLPGSSAAPDTSMTGSGPMHTDLAHARRLTGAAGAVLVDLTGPAILPPTRRADPAAG